MSTQNQMFVCDDKATVVEVICGGGRGELSCDGKPLVALTENTSDSTKEKHVPVVEFIGGYCKVSVGAEPHPMTPEHYIMLIEVISGSQTHRQNLNPGDSPVACFLLSTATTVTARAYCNLHGLWSD